MTVHPLIEALRGDVTRSVMKAITGSDFFPLGSLNDQTRNAIVGETDVILEAIDSRIGKVLTAAGGLRHALNLSDVCQDEINELRDAYDAAVRDGQGRVG